MSSERCAVAQFWSGTLPLEIEIGRYSYVKLEEQICKVCEGGVVEDEFHFILHCEAYETERNNFFQQLNI